MIGRMICNTVAMIGRMICNTYQLSDG
jgi:hypothetical protein